MHPLVKLIGYVFGLAAFVTPVAYADQQPNLESGASGGGFDTVNPMNGQLFLKIPLPILSPQRGGKLNFNFLLTANSVPWGVISNASGSSGACLTGNTPCTWSNTFGRAQTIGNLDGGVGLARGWDIALHRTYMSANDVGQPVDTASERNHYLVTVDGVTHQLQDVSGNKSHYISIDGTGYQVLQSNADSLGVYQSATIVDRNGNRYLTTWANNLGSTLCHSSTFRDGSGTVVTTTTCDSFTNTTQVTDANGNVYTLVGANGGAGQDTLGRVPPTEVTPATANTAACNSVAGLTIAATTPVGYPGYNGSTQSITLCYSNYTLQTAFGQAGVSEASVAKPLMVTAILPDGTKYTFDYDNYGNLTYVGLPTGGTVNYVWTTINLGTGSCGNAALLSRAVSTRTLNDNNGHTYTTNYAWGSLQSDGTLTNTVADASRNDTVHVFSTYATTAAGGVTGATGCQGLVETSTKRYQGSGPARSLLAQTDAVYQAQSMKAEATGNSDSAPFIGNVFATSVTTTNGPTGKVMKVVRSQDAGSGSGQPFFGDVVMEQTYDWGSGAPGALLKETDTTYLWQNDSRYYTAGLLDLPASRTVKDGGGNQIAKTTFRYDSANNLYPSNITLQHVGAPNAVRGNLASASSWLNTRTTPVTVPVDLYDTGMPYDTAQPANTAADHRTNFRYDSTGTYVLEVDFPSTTNAVFSSRPAIAHVLRAGYDFNTGLITSATDQNGNVTTFNYDNMNRRTTSTYPDNGQTINNYTPNTVSTLSQILAGSACSASPSSCTSALVTRDGLGRAIHATSATSGGDVNVDSIYDGSGRVLSVTNPYYTTSDKTYGVSSSQYDALGRATRMTKPDGSVGIVQYDQSVPALSGLCTLATDEAGKARESCSDALGRPTAVLEDPNGLALETDYAYASTANGSQQVTITQKGRPGTSSSQYRVHTSLYDSLGRLLSATNPENGTMLWTYDDNGNLRSKTDANNVETLYDYDQDNRLIEANPLDNGIGTYLLYDYNTVGPIAPRNPVGRIVASTTPDGTRWFTWDYDSRGRILQRTQCTGDANGDISPPTCGGESQAYDLIGDVIQRTYLTGYQVNYTYDRAGWVLSAKDSNGFQFANNITYVANGTVASIATPTFAYNYAYNNRFQPTQIGVGSLTTTLMIKDYAYNPGNNNGNVVTVTNETDAADSVAFGYDGLNRLVCAQAGVTTTGSDCAFGKGAWGNGYTYDDWGNLTAKINSGGVGESMSETIGANNRITKYTNQAGAALTPTYDNAGNITNDGVTGYTFDEWNRLTNTTAGNITNVYGPGGERWLKSSMSGTTYNWYGPQGEVLAEQRGGIFTYYVYVGGTRLARVQSNNGSNALGSLTDIKFYLTDVLGTTNKLVDKDGKTIVDNQDFFPFGGVVPGVGQVTSSNHYKFTGQERDAETGLDNFGARYYSSALGRWISADWEAEPSAIPYADAGNPQSFNLYSYVMNNPQTFRDIDGHHHAGFDGLYADRGADIPEFTSDQSGVGFDGPGKNIDYWSSAIFIYLFQLSIAPISGNSVALNFADRAPSGLDIPDRRADVHFEPTVGWFGSLDLTLNYTVNEGSGNHSRRALFVHYDRKGRFKSASYLEATDTSGIAKTPIDKLAAELILTQSVNRQQLALALESSGNAQNRVSDLGELYAIVKELIGFLK